MASTSDSQHLQGSIVPMQRAPRPIDPGVTIGHVHLRTADIDRVRAFYVDLMGFDVVMEARDVPGWGTTGDVLFVAAGREALHLHRRLEGIVGHADAVEVLFLGADHLLALDDLAHREDLVPGAGQVIVYDSGGKP